MVLVRGIGVGLLYLAFSRSLGAACTLVASLVLAYDTRQRASTIPGVNRPSYSSEVVGVVVAMAMLLGLLQAIATWLNGVWLLGSLAQFAYVGAAVIAVFTCTTTLPEVARKHGAGDFSASRSPYIDRTETAQRANPPVRRVNTTAIRDTLTRYRAVRAQGPGPRNSFPTLVTTTQPYFDARDAKAFTQQASLLQECDAAVSAFWKEELAKFNAVLASIRELKTHLQPVLDALAQRIAIGERLSDETLKIPAELLAQRQFSIPKHLEARSIATRVNNFTNAASQNLAKAAVTRDPIAAAATVVVAAGIGLFARGKWARELEEVAGMLSLYHTEVAESVGMLETLVRQRIDLMMNLLIECVEAICSIADAHDLTLDGPPMNLPESDRARLAFAIQRAQRLQSTPFE